MEGSAVEEEEEEEEESLFKADAVIEDSEWQCGHNI